MTRNKPTELQKQILRKMEKNTNVKEKATSLANGAGKMAQPQVDD